MDETRVDPIPWFPGYSYRNEHIIQYNRILEKFCREKGVRFIDILGRFRGKEINAFLDRDGAHLNPEGHKLVFETVRDFLAKEKII